MQGLSFNCPNIPQKNKSKTEERGKKRARESSEEASGSGRKGRGTSVSSADERRDTKRGKEDKGKSGFDKGLKAEKIIGEIVFAFLHLSCFRFQYIFNGNSISFLMV